MQALFVHGMGRTPLSGWLMIRRLRAANVATGTFAYFTATQDFAGISSRLASRIVQLAERGDYVLIGHSLGGVLLRSALASLPADTRPPSRVFLLGSPIRAARLAGRLKRNPIYRLVTGDCGQLLASDERMDRIGGIAAPTTAISGRYSLRPTRHVFGDEANDGVVSTAETSANWLAEELGVPVMHSFLPSDRRVAELILARIDQRLKAARDDLANRRPVWDALSDMFLDTDVALSRRWRASVLAESAYSIDDLETILINEVYPICKYNLLSIAGEWAGFDQQWLEEEILLRQAKLANRRWHLPRLKNPGRIPAGLLPEWQLTKAAIISARTATGERK